MTKKLKLEVTADDIAKGFKKDSAFCPIARAVKREFPTWQEVEVSDDGIKVLDDMNTNWLTGKEKSIDFFIRAFDSGHQVYPFTVEITFEEEVREPQDWDYD